MRVCAALLFVFGFAASAFAQPAESGIGASDHANERDSSVRWVLLEADWLPIVTAGYRLSRTRPRDFWASERAYIRHGLTAGVLLPVVASGSSDSRVRVAFGVGIGFDRMKDEERVESGFGGPESTRTSWVLATYAQLGAILRVSRGAWGWLASAVWTPGRTMVAVQEPGRRGHGWERSAARGRVTFGVVVRRVHVGLLLGGGYWAGDYSGSAFLPKSTQLELGLQLGSGW